MSENVVSFRVAKSARSSDQAAATSSLSVDLVTCRRLAATLRTLMEELDRIRADVRRVITQGPLSADQQKVLLQSQLRILAELLSVGRLLAVLQPRLAQATNSIC